MNELKQSMRLLAWIFAAICGFTTASAQSLESLPLVDLSSFEQRGDGWRIVGDAWALWNARALTTETGTGIVVRTSGDSHLVTEWEHGDLILELEYMLPGGGSSGVYLQGLYEVQIADSWGVAQPTPNDAGGISGRAFSGHAPRINAAKAPGLWQHLRVVFEAPRFDDHGRKVSNARIVDVVHNGVTVQEAVQLSGPTPGAPLEEEGPAGPLVFANEGTPVAFRNVRYRHFEPVEPVLLSDLRYELRRGEFSSLAQMEAAPVDVEGRAAGYVWNLFGRTADRIGLTWNGAIHIPRTGEYTFTARLNWIDEIPYEEDAVAGKGRFLVGDELVIDHTGADSAASGTIYLQEGTHPFTLSYFKNRRLWRPIVFFRVEGPGMPGQYLNAYRTLPEPETSYPPVHADVLDEPYVLRSFADYDSLRLTNVISVGDPKRVHYAVDANAGTLLAAWKGPFVDVGSMWTARGELQNAVPLGQLIQLSYRPSIELPAGSALQFDGYALDADDDRPVFRYARHGMTVTDELKPEQEGRVLRRSLRLSVDTPEEMWVRVADGKNIRQRGEGVFSVDGAYFIEFAGGEEPLVRERGEGEELIAPVTFIDGEAAVSYVIIW